MKTPEINEVKKWLSDNGIGTGTNITVGAVAQLIVSYHSQLSQPSDVSDEQRNKIVESCKDELLKHLFMVKYVQNDYPIEAVPKATLLELPALMKSGHIKPTIEGGKDRDHAITGN